MKTTFIYLCFLIIGHRDGSRAANYEEFKPTPIPLNEWKGSMAEGGAGANTTLHDVTAVDPPATAYYWEDALRHSVYLSLVRDKIDELIAKGTGPKPDSNASKVVDDHNLWANIKTAPFDRLKPQEAPILGDITILAKGRLLENKDGFRFAEDASEEKCNDAKCMDRVKAFWSVKRVRQRDAGTIPGQYHYELTFTIRSQTHKQHKKPYEHPVRTFTVQVSNPTEEPKLRVPEPTEYVPKLHRAIWFHRNINPMPNYHSRKTYQGSSLDRLFFSLFSDDDEDEYLPRYKPAYQPQTTQQSKVGQVGPVDQYHQKKVPPYRYKHPSIKYSHRPPVTQNFAPTPISHPPVQQLNDLETKYTHQPDHKYLPTNIVKTIRNAVLPTPSFSQTNFTVETTNRPNATESTTKATDTISSYMIITKQKQPPTKVNYQNTRLPEHVRPPVFNAPPGVFVTMEKKPFKPMPPLMMPYYNSKVIRPKPPANFRPSPQVLDAQFSDPEPLSDSFRPITMNHADRNKTELHDLAAGILSKNRTNSKPSKKHENKNSHRTTTSTPEIITAQPSLSMDKITLDSMHWANNILGAFSKTTPMASEKMNFSFIDDLLTMQITTTTAVPTEATATLLATTEEEVVLTTTEPSTTTQFIPKPKKRTRPTPKLPELKENPIKKIKKHKRITSTTSTSTTTSTTTVRPRPLSKRLPDLTPQASSAATGNKELEPEIQHDKFTTTSTTVDLRDTTTAITTTTPRPTPIIRSTIKTTTTSAPTTTNIAATTTEDRNKNRFRQTMLMQKGTSVNHDKWSTTNNSYVDRTKTVIPLANKYQQQVRRKASNFHGYVSSIQKTVEEERKKDDEHRDRLPDSYFNVIPTTVGKAPDARTETMTSSSQEHTAEHVTNVEFPPRNSDEVQYNEQEENTNGGEGKQEIKDHSEYIFSVTTEDSNDHELGDPELITVTEISVINTPYSSGKNKAKCKKKKHVTDEASISSNDSDEILTSTTEAPADSDIFHEIFGFTVDDVKLNGTNTEQMYEGSEQYEHYLHPEDDLETFIESLNVNRQEREDVYDEGDVEISDDYPNNNHEGRTLRHEDILELQEHPFTFLELMDMK